MSEKIHLTKVDTKTLSYEYKNKILKFLIKMVQEKRMKFTKKHPEIVKSVCRLAWDRETGDVDIRSVEPIVLVLAQMVYEALQDNDDAVYLTKVTENSVFGLKGRNT